jgi:arsenite/tail-anchored protein-transporting ATPase
MFFYLLKANKLEQLRERMVKVHELFRDTESTEFVIVTIPTVTTVSVTS